MENNTNTQNTQNVRYSARKARRAMETPAEKEERLQHRRELRIARKNRERETEARNREIRIRLARIEGGLLLPEYQENPHIRYGGNPLSPFQPRADVHRIPPHILSELVETAERCGAKWACPVCMDDHAPREMKIAPCGHKLCGGCRMSLQHPECPECRAILP